MPDIYVAHVTLDTGDGYTSLHRTETGAWSAILDWLRRGGIAVARGKEDLDGHDRIESYGVSYLPIED
jgi:hypothetical protein